MIENTNFHISAIGADFNELKRSLNNLTPRRFKSRNTDLNPHEYLTLIVISQFKPVVGKGD